MKKKALITGVTGQDGSYLAEFLLKKNYIVHGIKRKSSTFNTSRIDHIYQDVHKSSNFLLHYGDLADSNSLVNVINKIKPNEIYNLGAQSHVGHSFEIPEYTSEVSGLGTLRILEAMRFLKLNKTKFYQASTSELFGEVHGKKNLFDEKSIMTPKSPYGVSKLYSYWITKVYREAYGFFACNGILFNHESPRRGETFVTRKITRGLARINEGLDDCIYMGNLDSLRDWGHAKEYVELQWLMLQQELPEDFVIATGRQESVRKFIELSAKELGWWKDTKKPAIIWEGSALDEIGRRADNNEIVVRIDKRYFRPTEVSTLLGDATKAKDKLSWETKITLEQLVAEMIKNDLEDARKESYLLNKGFKVNAPYENPPGNK